MSLFVEFVFPFEFFNPNICHICKTPWDLNKNFITCNQCHMISYCNSDHELMHNERHMQICEAMRNVSISHPQLWSISGINLEEWVQTRKQLVRLIQFELQRDLQPFEVQMITLAKSCIICYRQDNLLHCLKCYSVNYCYDHQNLLADHYRFNCRNLELSFRVNIELNLSPIIIDKFTEFPDENKFIDDMYAFISEFVSTKYKLLFGPFSTSLFYISFFYSDFVSGPLTLYYGIRKINRLDCIYKSDSCFVIHIINANLFDRKYLPAWELILHLLPNIKELKIILIGPILRTESGDLMVCNIRCIQQYLNFETHRMLYHNYVDSECYKQPNVIIGFQADLSNWETLPETILKIKCQECPFLLTSKSKDTVDQNVNKIKEILKSPICDVLYLTYNGKNKFSSYRPYRDYENGSVSYLNKYLTVYKRL
ncbi:uncharacterized protein LOC116844126 [Odontomachus brunneus]|uniref:uncharacterized protein LOC116844126 n=1 Tax=Odontomachus brunneus TaxID=486640 RepID=UPI0013F21D83|nr:uncharacterized protein LOC116844126 [Odontomachus brunneus]